MQSRKGPIAALIAAASLFAAVFYLITADPQKTAASDNGFKQEVRNALNEIGIAHGASNSDRAVAVENLAAFISYRAGVLLSDAGQQALLSSEDLAASNGKSIGRDDLAAILTSLAVERFETMTDEELDAALNALRGFDHPDLPPGFRRGRDFVSLRANGQGRMRVEDLRTQVLALRGSASSDRMTRSLVRNSIALEIGRVCDLIIDAAPDFFRGPKCGMSPAQAFLVSYAVVTDDLLAGNRAAISERMRKLQETAASESNGAYPSPIGHTPYGRNGYIFSTPADLFFDQATAGELISRLNEAIN